MRKIRNDLLNKWVKLQLSEMLGKDDTQSPSKVTSPASCFKDLTSLRQSLTPHHLVYVLGGDLVPTMPGCVCPKVKDIGPFLASRE